MTITLAQLCTDGSATGTAVRLKTCDCLVVSPPNDHHRRRDSADRQDRLTPEADGLGLGSLSFGGQAWALEKIRGSGIRIAS
jgi:hypothetical protein